MLRPDPYVIGSRLGKKKHAENSLKNKPTPCYIIQCCGKKNYMPERNNLLNDYAVFEYSILLKFCEKVEQVQKTFY